VTFLVDMASWALFVAGGGLMLIGGLGMVRLPNFFARLHASGLVDTGGAAALLLGMALQAGWSMVTVKLVLIGIFLFFTSPTASHAVAHASLLGGLAPDVGAKRDDGPDAGA